MSRRDCVPGAKCFLATILSLQVATTTWSALTYYPTGAKVGAVERLDWVIMVTERI